MERTLEELANDPTDQDLLDQLDGFGHLTWTVGNEDWMACFDAVRHDDRIAYHVVVDCQSGGFVETVENGVIAAKDVKDLETLPGKYADICMGQYHDQEYGEISYADTVAEWKRHLAELAKD